jgi:uncharacterized protein with PIN domain
MELLTLAERIQKEKEELLKRRFELLPREVLALTDIEETIKDYKAGLINPRELRQKIEKAFCKIDIDQPTFCSVCNKEIKDLDYEIIQAVPPENWSPLCLECFGKKEEI